MSTQNCPFKDNSPNTNTHTSATHTFIHSSSSLRHQSSLVLARSFSCSFPSPCSSRYLCWSPSQIKARWYTTAVSLCVCYNMFSHTCFCAAIVFADPSFNCSSQLYISNKPVDDLLEMCLKTSSNWRRETDIHTDLQREHHDWEQHNAPFGPRSSATQHHKSTSLPGVCRHPLWRTVFVSWTGFFWHFLCYLIAISQDDTGTERRDHMQQKVPCWNHIRDVWAQNVMYCRC